MVQNEKNRTSSIFNPHASGTIATSLSGAELTRGDNTFLRYQDLTSAQITGLSNSLKP